MRLTLETRDVGRVTIVRCKGRLVAGPEVEALRTHIAWVLRDRRSIVLHLGEIVFVDSSGLGTLVRTLTSARQVRGDLKLCDVPEHVRKVLALSHMNQLFDSHESEDGAVAAFYRASAPAEKPAAKGKSVLCLGRNVDVVTYLREFLRRAGYDVHSSNSLRDGQILMRVTRFDLLLMEAGLFAAPGTEQSFRALSSGIPVLELPYEFSTLEAGEATSALLAQIAARLGTAAAPSS